MDDCLSRNHFPGSGMTGKPGGKVERAAAIASHISDTEYEKVTPMDQSSSWG